jgi:hypothetical protein
MVRPIGAKKIPVGAVYRQRGLCVFQCLLFPAVYLGCVLNRSLDAPAIRGKHQPVLSAIARTVNVDGLHSEYLAENNSDDRSERALAYCSQSILDLLSVHSSMEQ